MINTSLCIYKQFFSFRPLSLPPKTFAPVVLTTVTADRYVVANSHYGRAYTEKPGPSHNTGVLLLLTFGYIFIRIFCINSINIQNVYLLVVNIIAIFAEMLDNFYQLFYRNFRTGLSNLILHIFSCRWINCHNPTFNKIPQSN